MPEGIANAPPLSRVLMSADAVGGVWQYALELARGLSTHGVETVLAVLGPKPGDGAMREAHAIRGLRLIHTGLPLDWTARSEREVLGAAFEVARLADRFGVDVVHLNAPALAACDYAAPVVAVAHSCVATWWQAVRGGVLPADFAWRARLTAKGLAVASAVIAPTGSFANAIADVYGAPYPITVVRNGRSAASSRNVVRRRRCVFTAGRLWDDGKNIALLDRAAAQIDAPVFAAGETNGPNGAAARFENLHSLGRIAMAELISWYETTGVFVSPSRYEPFGLSVLEAAQTGAPLVLADISTFRELWDGAALFFDKDDADALAHAVRSVLDAPDRAAELGARARSRAERYGADAMVAGTLTVYRSLLLQARAKDALREAS
jgi:glycosyltransferase involved in cell wall biosynthesis